MQMQDAEEYWLAHPEAVLHMKATDNMGYVPYKGALLPRLEAAIRGVHAQVRGLHSLDLHLHPSVASSDAL